MQQASSIVMKQATNYKQNNSLEIILSYIYKN